MVSDAIKRANAMDRLLVAFDVNQDTLDGIKAGTIEATIAQKPYTMGYYGLKSLDELLHNPPTHMDQGFCRGFVLAISGICGYGDVAGGQE